MADDDRTAPTSASSRNCRTWLCELCNTESRRTGLYFALRSARQPSEVTPWPDRNFQAQLAGFSLTTAEILYRLPDHPSLLQSFIWQEYDVHPRFPRLKSFLDFWSATWKASSIRVTVAHNRLISPAELRLVGGEYRVH